MSETFAIETPEQLRVVSDPFRQRLLGVFAEPATVKAAAEKLGVPLGRLYHHVDQLAAAGLIRVVSERKRRATTERTFQAVAKRFKVRPSAMAGEPLAGGAPIVRAAVEELLASAPTDCTPETALHIARTRLRLTPERLALLEQKLGELLKALETADGLETEILLVASPRPSLP
jgi:hypothetical protein